MDFLTGKCIHQTDHNAQTSAKFFCRIHTDTNGNVYSSCGDGDGVSVWNPEGVLIGKFAVADGSNNFAFVPGGMYIFNAYNLFKVNIKAEGRVVKRDFGLQS